jgi:TatD DNase family protein
MFKYYDIHTHINYDPLVKQADSIAASCLKKDIIFNNIGTNLISSQLAIEQANKYENVYACVGIHPNDVNNLDSSSSFAKLETLIKSNKKIVGIGETGLDYHYQTFDKNKQRVFFIKHIKLARKYNLPLMVHIRDAHVDAYNILKEHASNMKVIIHCFSGNDILAKKYTDLGFYISIPGVITFKNANELRQAIKTIPLNLLLSETDAPWLTPVPHRGETNTPEYVIYIVKEIAKVLSQDENFIKNTLFNNAIKLFLTNS